MNVEGQSRRATRKKLLGELKKRDKLAMGSWQIKFTRFRRSVQDQPNFVASAPSNRSNLLGVHSRAVE